MRRVRVVLAFVTLVSSLAIAGPGEAQSVCRFRGSFSWSQAGPNLYNLFLDGVSMTACPDLGANESFLIQGSGTATHVGRCSSETTMGGLPWPTIDNINLDMVAFDLGATFFTPFTLTSGNPGRHVFPGPTPVPLYYRDPDYFDGLIPAGTASLLTRIFGNCPPRGNPTAHTDITFSLFL